MVLDLKIFNIQSQRPKPGACFVLRTPQHVTLGKAASAATHNLSASLQTTPLISSPLSPAVALYPNLYQHTIAIPHTHRLR